MSVGGLLALICIILGFIVGATNASIFFGAVDWFIAAIAIVLTLGGVSLGSFTIHHGSPQG